jgi:hypothetical protein
MWRYQLSYKTKNGKTTVDLARELIQELKMSVNADCLLKLNFFLECKTLKNYLKSCHEIGVNVADLLGEHILVSVIPQKPINASLALEAIYLNHKPLHLKKYHSVTRQRLYFTYEQNEFLLVSSFFGTGNTRMDADNCFKQMRTAADEFEMDFSHIIRQWNYIGDITGLSGRPEESQNYQQFNNIRAFYYDQVSFHNGYPAATGIGMSMPGVLIECLFVKNFSGKVLPLKNPKQEDAYKYSDSVLYMDASLAKASPPKFERAKILKTDKYALVLISGTAAIYGESSFPVMNEIAQTHKVFDVLSELLTMENMMIYEHYESIFNQKFTGIRVYIKSGTLAIELKRLIENYFFY